MDSPAIGYTVKHLTTGEFGHVVTYYDNGDLYVYVGHPMKGGVVDRSVIARWPINEVTSLGRRR